MIKPIAAALAATGLVSAAVAAPATPAPARASVSDSVRAAMPAGQRVNRQDGEGTSYLLIGAAVVAAAVGLYFIIDDEDDSPTSA